MRRQAAARTAASFSAGVRPFRAIEKRSSLYHELPLADRKFSRFKRLRARPAPELLGVNMVTALDLAVLLGPAGLNVAVANAHWLDRQDEAEGELGPVVGLDLSNRKRHGEQDLRQEVQARRVFNRR